MQNHTDYISLNVVHYAFSNGSSNVLPEMMRNHIGSICLTFLHCVFSNKSSKCLLDKKQNHTFAIVCFQMGPQIACLIRCIATGSSRKNDKSKSHSKGVYFYKIFIFTPVPGRKIATNYSPTPSRSLKNVLRLP